MPGDDLDPTVSAGTEPAHEQRSSTTTEASPNVAVPTHPDASVGDQAAVAELVAQRAAGGGSVTEASPNVALETSAHAVIADQVMTALEADGAALVTQPIGAHVNVEQAQVHRIGGRGAVRVYHNSVGVVTTTKRITGANDERSSVQVSKAFIADALLLVEAIDANGGNMPDELLEVFVSVRETLLELSSGN